VRAAFARPAAGDVRDDAAAVVARRDAAVAFDRLAVAADFARLAVAVAFDRLAVAAGFARRGAAAAFARPAVPRPAADLTVGRDAAAGAFRLFGVFAACFEPRVRLVVEPAVRFRGPATAVVTRRAVTPAWRFTWVTARVTVRRTARRRGAVAASAPEAIPVAAVPTTSTSYSGFGSASRQAGFQPRLPVSPSRRIRHAE
jgi:hypothetical protein